MKKYNFAIVVYARVEVKTDKGKNFAEITARTKAWQELNVAIINNTDFTVKDIEIEVA